MYNQERAKAMTPPRAFTPKELRTMTEATLATLSPADRRAFFLAAARATDPRYPWPLDTGDTAPKVFLEDFIQGDYDQIDSRRRFEFGE